MNRSLFNVVGLFVISLGLVACKDNTTTAPPTSYYIIGQVTGSTTGGPVSGVTVEVGGNGSVADSSAVTDPDGKYQVLNTGHKIFAMKRGYNTYYANIDNLSRISTVTYDISLAPGSTSDTTAPPFPLAGKIDPVDNFIFWYPPIDTTDVAGYTVYRDNVAIKTTSFNGLWDYGAIAGSPICYSVSTFDASGNESLRSGEMCATASSCGSTAGPYYIELSVVSSTAISLDWISNNPWPHNIYRDGVLIKSLAAGENTTHDTTLYYVTYSDTSLSPGTKYCYSVTAMKSSGETSPCPGICITTWP